MLMPRPALRTPDSVPDLLNQRAAVFLLRRPALLNGSTKLNASTAAVSHAHHQTKRDQHDVRVCRQPHGKARQQNCEADPVHGQDPETRREGIQGESSDNARSSDIGDQRGSRGPGGADVCGIRRQEDEGDVHRHAAECQADVEQQEIACPQFFGDADVALRSRNRRASLHGGTEQEQEGAAPPKDLEAPSPSITFDEHGRQRCGDQRSATDTADGEAQRNVPPQPEPFSDGCDGGHVHASDSNANSYPVGEKQKRQRVGPRRGDEGSSHQHSAGSYKRARSMTVRQLSRERCDEKR